MKRIFSISTVAVVCCSLLLMVGCEESVKTPDSGKEKLTDPPQNPIQNPQEKDRKSHLKAKFTTLANSSRAQRTNASLRSPIPAMLN